jgi:hypothetical protein
MMLPLTLLLLTCVCFLQGFAAFGVYYMYAPDAPRKPAAPKQQPAAAKAAAAAAKKDDDAAAPAAAAADEDDEDDVGESSAVKPATRASRRRA